MPEAQVIEDGANSLPATIGTAVPESLALGLTRAEIDVQIETARRHPRDLPAVRNRVKQLVTLDPETAEDSMYALPRGGKPIVGPSIRFAETVQQQYGNCRAAARVVFVGDTYVEAEGVFHDLETNSASLSRIQRRIVDKYGRRFKEDMILVTGNAACSIAKRNAILGGVPRAVWNEGYKLVQKVVAGDVKTLAETRDRAIKAFAQFGVKPEQVFAALGVSDIEGITLQSIPVLKGMYAALRSGEATVEEMFNARATRGSDFNKVANPMADDEPTEKAPEPEKADPEPQEAQTEEKAFVPPDGEKKSGSKSKKDKEPKTED